MSLSLSSRAVSILLPISLAIGAADGFYGYRVMKSQEAVASQHRVEMERIKQSLDRAEDNYTDLI